MRELYKELGCMTAWSVLIYGLLFAALWLVEYLCPNLHGTLLQWDNAAFVVGIPSSVLGTAYVLTIRNPRNYLGFYFGIVMSVLLSVQFYLQGSYDMVVLYLAVFVPFLVMAIVSWRRDTLRPATEVQQETMRPAFISVRQLVLVLLVSAVIVVADYALATLVIYHDAWSDQVLRKLLSALAIVTSFFANYLMIYKKNDAWVCWVLYCLASLMLMVLLRNIFSIVLFAVMLVVNFAAQVAWLRMTEARDFGWVGSEQFILRLRHFIHRH